MKRQITIPPKSIECIGRLAISKLQRPSRMETLPKNNSVSLSAERNTQSRFVYIMTVLPTTSENGLEDHLFRLGTDVLQQIWCHQYLCSFPLFFLNLQVLKTVSSSQTEKNIACPTNTVLSNLVLPSTRNLNSSSRATSRQHKP